MFTLTAMSQSAFTSEEIVTPNQHYIFTVQENASCDMYSFQVRAVAESGNSNLSEEVRGVVPSLPDISLVETALDYSLSKAADGDFMLNISFQVNIMGNKFSFRRNFKFSRHF